MRESPESFASTKETVEPSFEKASEGIVDCGYNFHEQEHDGEGRDPKVYHTSEHPRTMEQRAERMADVFHLKPKQRAVMKMAIAWHDTVIDYDKANPNNLLAMVRRHRGAREGDKPYGAEGNEGRSARHLEQEMRQANERAGKEIFTGEQIETAGWAVDGTYPDADLGPDFKGATFKDYPYYDEAIRQNPALGDALNNLEKQGIIKGPLFFQPHLEQPLEAGQTVPREVLIVGLSDLGAAGSADNETFFKEGDDEMIELYANLRRPEVMYRLIDGNDEADRNDREKVSAAYLGWLDSQPGFAAWQALRFEKLIHLLKRQNGLATEEERGLRAEFNRFIDNIRSASERAKELRSGFDAVRSSQGEKAAFSYLAGKLHYEDSAETRFPLSTPATRAA